MYRTPTNNRKSEEPQKSPEEMAANATFSVGAVSKEGEPKTKSSSVRRSIGEWESGTPDPQPSAKRSPVKKVAKELAKQKPTVSITRDRVAEARAWVVKAKTNLGDSRNISTVIKNQVILAIDRLFALVKEAELARGQTPEHNEEMESRKELNQEKGKGKENEDELRKSIEEHKILLQENTKKIDELKEIMERKTYASVAAAVTGSSPPERSTLHSVVVTGKNEIETGEQILGRIRNAVNAKEGWVTVERVRKAKDRKVIVGCKTEEERKKLKERLSTAAEHLSFEDIKNKDPLIVLKDVLQSHTDAEILEALKKQNKSIFEGIGEEGTKVEIRYRRPTRNPHMTHIVMRVSPALWQRITSAGVVSIDLQRVRVADQSPLVQCSMCLGYGHGRRFCKETLERCSHCAGPHKKNECADWLAGSAPLCINCNRAKAEKTEHNAFSSDCPIRKKWDELARATVAYS